MFITTILFLLFSINVFGQQAFEINKENKLLWEITTKDRKEKSYIFGSYHSNDKRVFDFSDSVYVTLNQAQIIVVETDIYAMFKDWDTREAELSMEFDTKGKPYTRSKEATRTSYGSEDGMPQFLDLYFLQYGFNTNKEYYALESIEDQMNIINNPFSFSNPFVNKYFNAEEKALNFYLNGDVDALERLMKSSFKWNPNFYDKLITERNVIMANGIDTLLKKGNLFIAIGAGHLGGDKGVINLLRSKGHQVRPVLNTKSELPIKEKKQVLAEKNYIFLDSTSNLRAVLPGKPFDIEKEGTTLNLIFREMGQGNTYTIEVIEKQEGQTVETVANDYIQSPGDSKKNIGQFEDGSIYVEGISDSYPEGISWIRVIDSDHHFAILKAYGGNKFMHSKRPQNFFNSIYFILSEDDPR